MGVLVGFYKMVYFWGSINGVIEIFGKINVSFFEIGF